MVAYASVNSLHQDYYGKEAYLARAEALWVSPYYTVPLAIFILVVASSLFGIFSSEEEEMANRLEEAEMRLEKEDE